MSQLAHPMDMVQPPPTPLHHFLYNAVDDCGSAHLFVGDVLLPSESEDSAEASSFEVS